MVRLRAVQQAVGPFFFVSLYDSSNLILELRGGGMRVLEFWSHDGKEQGHSDRAYGDWIRHHRGRLPNLERERESREREQRERELRERERGQREREQRERERAEREIERADRERKQIERESR